HYVLMNIECGGDTLTELEHAFKFNDAVLRHLIVAKTEAVATPSPMMKEEKSRSLTGKDSERGERPAAEPTPAPVEPPAAVTAGSAIRCEGFLARRYRTGNAVALHITRFTNEEN